ncbi:CBD9-like protein [Lojkania enalia]|uniref:CBD9-like protein n=1 Tax=Lojkania enalia TaxID=147567 RepID=A0A9P4K1W8_9PLEO|nr:CBD9-like protein [Didymosphaeria enalia]
MKLSPLLFITLAAAQTPSPYTDPQSGITFNTFIEPSSGYFFGIALPEDTSNNTDFIATLGSKGTGWSGVSLGGGMLNKLLIVAWPNGQSVVASFRKTANFGNPPVTTGSFTQKAIANGTYVNSTHWRYTFLCEKCILMDKTTFGPSDTAPNFGWARNSAAPAQKPNAAAAVSKHQTQGQYSLDLTKAMSADFGMWKSWAGM